MAEQFDFDVCVVGGGGHVGFPLAVAFASRGLRVCIYDINAAAVETINAGRAPFLEPGVQEPLARGAGVGAAGGDDRPRTRSAGRSTS